MSCLRFSQIVRLANNYLEAELSRYKLVNIFHIKASFVEYDPEIP